MHLLDPALPPQVLVGRLDRPVRDLISACRVLYEGDWDGLAEDLRRRRAGRPYLFRLRAEPPDALEWIHQFKTYEATRGERLADALADDNKGSVPS